MKTAIKICGVRDPDIAKQAVEMGARYIGIMCFRGSVRYVTPEQGKLIADAVKAAGGIPVAVFVDADAQHMLSICHLMGVSTVQLHGTISRQSHPELPDNIRRIYVLSVNKQGQIQPDVDHGVAQLETSRDAVMFDGLVGGSGQRYNVSELVNPYSMPFFLAGGLTPDNVAEVIGIVHPDVVDVSSGVESERGVKDLKKIEAFIVAVRGKNNE